MGRCGERGQECVQTDFSQGSRGTHWHAPTKILVKNVLLLTDRFLYGPLNMCDLFPPLCDYLHSYSAFSITQVIHAPQGPTRIPPLPQNIHQPSSSDLVVSCFSFILLNSVFNHLLAYSILCLTIASVQCIYPNNWKFFRGRDQVLYCLVVLTIHRRKVYTLFIFN